MKHSLILLILVFFSVAIHSQEPVATSERKLIGEITGLPVKKGIVLSCYHPRGSVTYTPSPIVPVYTYDDSAFYFEEAIITSVYKIDDAYYVITKNDFGEIIGYCNLRSTPCKKGEKVHSGSYIGQVGKEDNEDEKGNALEILVIVNRPAEEIEELKRTGRFSKGDVHKALTYDECVEYILKRMSNTCGSNSATSL